jgi:hypothetical protein
MEYAGRMVGPVDAGTMHGAAAFLPVHDTGERSMVREGPPQPPPPPKEPYPAEKARGGEIILNTPLRRWVFVGGLTGAIVLVLVLSLVRWAV